MLTIHEGFPIKKMALYGSTAFIVGFAGTITMLREYAPKDESGNISVVHPSNKQEAKKSSVSNQVPRTENKNENTTPDAVTPLATSTPVAGTNTMSTRQASPMPLATSSGGTVTGGGTMNVAPATSAPAPVVSSSPQPTGGSGSTATQPTPTTTQPTNPLPVVPIIQNTVNNLDGSTSSLLP